MTSVVKQHEYPRHEYSAIARYSLPDFASSGCSSFDREFDSPYARFSIWVSKQDMDLCLSNVMITREDANVLSSMNMDWLSLGASISRLVEDVSNPLESMKSSINTRRSDLI